MKQFKSVESRQNLPKTEEKILEYWDKEKIFEASLRKNREKKPYSFYDGPPFATGTPHYGHIVGSVMKDAVPRYWTMRGFHVERRWGWDCHGLPIENIVEKELGSQSKKDIEEVGIEKFNALCRKNVLGYVDEWEKVIKRVGRWADMEDSYKTMDPEFMESVWWVFKSLWDKGYVYHDHRSMHICPRCETTLSQSEVTEGYMDVKDLSATSKFELVDEPGTYVLAWTTTPWTLIGNAALALHSDVTYSKVQIQGEDHSYIMASERLEDVMKEKEYSVLEKMKGEDLLGKSYKPLFDFYAHDKNLEHKENGWKIYHGDFVTTEDGTGVVHIAPAFGEDDMSLGKKENLPFIQHVGMDGLFRSETGDFAGLHVKPKDDHMKTDIEIIRYLAHNGLLFHKEKYEHSYPHCWRCDTPLLNYATESWFVNVTKLKTGLLANAKHINWSPEHMKEGRFGNWLEGARDWSISRQRFWASVMPIWKCDTCDEKRVMGSVMDMADKFDGVNRLFLARHGESEHNVLGILNSIQDKEKFGLVDLGKEQVAQVAQELKDKSIDVIIRSPLRRTRETADILNEVLGVEVHEDERLRETDFGTLHDRSKDELHTKYASAAERIDTDGSNGVESLRDVEKRLREFLVDLNKKYAGKNIVIVSHADPTRVLWGITKHKTIEETVRSWYPSTGTMRTTFSKEVDLHRPYIDEVVLDCDCGGKMHRVSDVLDTWFDSGSMPYAQMHYPFESGQKFDSGFPADFIAEGVDQTRAWFYYLHVIAGAIQEKHAFKNVIVNGIVLAEDGKKMAKKLKNYPDPSAVMDTYGADVLRYYLLSSPVVMAENLNFSEKEMGELARGMFRMLWNSYSFFVMYANIDKWQPSDEDAQPTALLDKWILSELQVLTRNVNNEMEQYELAKAVRNFPAFVDNLSNWYIRRSRRRFWKSEDDGDKKQAYATLHYVLVELSKLIAPFMPFLSEEIYRNLTGGKSVHLEEYPQANKSLIDESVLGVQMKRTREVINSGLQLRAQAGIKVRQPLEVLYAVDFECEDELIEVLKEELNVKRIELQLIEKNDSIQLAMVGEMQIGLDIEITPELKLEGQAREIVRSIQSMRKEADYNVDDRICVSHQGAQEVFEKFGETIIAKEVLALELSDASLQDPDLEKEVKIDDMELKLQIKR